ncbi:BRCA1-associated RING domain protein 1-like isoform X2 [Asparagus officinalis]|uniref:BRCA1-associated RING domain protein 1-like isoform X2 n=1 Tax=Asparagus officinalis TaxID=4686 RepID=UPI00098E7414|nr:BRCA1-associated RING domain protein 1-like isoform X2 [Asparagus officinalis]
MGDSEALVRCLNPVILNLQKMELELKCPACLKLLDLPIMLPCSHIFCSHCIPTLIKSGSECPSCKLSFLNQDLRPAGHVKSLIIIYNDMKSAVAANFPQQKSEDRNFDKKVPTSEGPSSDNNYVIDISQRELMHNMVREKLSDPQLYTSNTMTPREGKSNGPPMQRSGEEALIDGGEQCSPPSFGSIKDSDCDNSDNGRQHQIKRSILTVKEKEVGNEPREHVETGRPKRQKLNSESDAGDKVGIGSVEFATPNPDCEHKHSDCSDTHPLETSKGLSANRTVECMFCHSFKTTEASGKMLHLLNGEGVGLDQATHPNVMNVHEKCIEWAPQVYFSGETVKNLKSELARASKIKCTSCGLKGAALGCYVKSCKRSYHAPCAYNILECRWDCENYLVLCPAHASHKLPCDKSKKKSKSNGKQSPDPSGTSGDLSSSSTPEHGNLTSSSIWDRHWVFCGSALSKEEKGLVEKLGRISESDVTNMWKPTVTHVIASVDENGGCSRTLKFLMAILTGKWVLTIEWVKACIQAGHPVPEEPYEVTHDVHGCFDGPKIGRSRAMEKAPKLFDGISFYIADDFQQPALKKYIEDLINAGDGELLQKSGLVTIREAILDCDSDTIVQHYFNLPKVFVHSAEPPATTESGDFNDVLKQRSAEGEAWARDIGGHVLSHTSLLDSVAACHFDVNRLC